MKSVTHFQHAHMYIKDLCLRFRVFNIQATSSSVSPFHNPAESLWLTRRRDTVFRDAMSVSDSIDSVMFTTEIAPFKDMQELCDRILSVDTASSQKIQFELSLDTSYKALLESRFNTCLVSCIFLHMGSSGLHCTPHLLYSDKEEHKGRVFLPKSYAGQDLFANTVRIDVDNVRDLAESNAFDKFLYTFGNDCMLVR